MNILLYYGCKQYKVPYFNVSVKCVVCIGCEIVMVGHVKWSLYILYLYHAECKHQSSAISRQVICFW